MPGFGSVGVWEVILILAVLLLVFGARRLPEIGAALGKGIREFKSSVSDIQNEINRPGEAPRGDLPRSRPNEAPRAETPMQEAPRTDEPAPHREVDSTRPGSERPAE
jgi:sec-independent protein translocase protein TatA